MSDHPDFEALSASLDGEDEAAAAHAAACPTCRAALGELRSVREAVGGPVRPRVPESVDIAIAGAVAAADEWEEADEGVEPAPQPGRREPGSLRRDSRWRLWLAGSAAAAVLAIVVLTALVVGGGSGGRDDTALSAGPAGDKASQEAAPPAAAPGASGAASPALGGSGGSGGDGVVVQELGDVSDIATLRSRMAASSAQSSAAARSSTEAAAPVPRVVGTRVCEIEARNSRPQLGVVVAVANLRFQGTQAVALGFAPAPGATPVTLLVLAPGESCRLLAEATIP